MLSLAPTVRVYVAPGATNLQKSFDGLVAAAERIVGAAPMSGHVFAFCNRRRNMLKLLAWDGSGFVVFAKRLERGTFAWPEPREGESEVVIEADELSWILGGLDLRRLDRRKWWRMEPRSAS